MNVNLKKKKKKSTMTPIIWDGIGIPATPEHKVQVHTVKLNGPYFEEQFTENS